MHSFFPVFIRFGRAIVWGYTLSCLIVSREKRVQGYTISKFKFPVQVCVHVYWMHMVNKNNMHDALAFRRGLFGSE